ncbi:MAG: membrane integrity-associated transporter subunit PqiC [Bdellovibrionales bacterium]
MKRLMACLALIWLASCGTSPEPAYYTLAPVPGAQVSHITASFKIQRPGLPRYLDRPDIVSQSNLYRIDIDQRNRWAAPLDRMIERVLAENMRQRMPNASIVSESETSGILPRYVVEIDIQQFNRVEGGDVVLKAQLSVRDRAGALRTEVLSLAAAASSSPSSQAEALSRLTGRMADYIVAMILLRS